MRADVEAEARSDPLARATLLALVGTAGVALLLAALGLALAVRIDLRDDGGEHFDLEAQGASPGFLRRVVRARAATVTVVGLVGGLLAGLGLLLLVTRMVTVTAGGSDAEPPLAVVVEPALVALGVVLFGVLATLLVGFSTRRALPRELSGGEQQRIALCAAVAHRPRLVIADEPTGDLDAESAAEVLRLLAELVAENGSSAVIVSHDDASTAIADRVVHVRDGRVSEKRTGAIETAVVGAGGWLRIPEETLRAAGIGDRARIVVRDGSVGLHPVDGSTVEPVEEPAGVKGTRGEVVEARGVVRRYGAQLALDGVDATFLPGELSVVVGPSGSGKSTLLALLAGLDVPDGGEVWIGATSVSELDREERAALRRERVSVIGQAPGLSGFLSARENVELGLALREVERNDARERASEALAAVGLAQHAERRVDLLSAGQRERVALARVFAARAPLVVADEPTSRLDASTTVAIGTLLAELAHDTGTTVVCATHDPLLIGLADREVRLGVEAPVASL